MDSEEKDNLQDINEQSQVPKDVVKGIFERKNKERQESDLLGQELSKEVPIKTPQPNKTLTSSVSTKRPSKKEFLYPTKRMWSMSSSLGIDIGSHSIKIVQLSKSGHQVRVDKMIIAELPSEVIESNDNKSEILKQILKSAFKKAGLKGKAFSVIPNDQVSIKNITLPRIPDSELAGAIEWQIKQDLDDPDRNIVFDYLIMNEGPTKSPSENMQALVVISKRKDIVNHMELLNSLGVQCLAIEPNTFSLISSLAHNGRFKDKEVSLVIDFGGYESSLCVVRNKELNFVRKLDVNSYSFISAIKESLNISFEAAEQIIKNNYCSIEGTPSEKDERNRAMIISALVFQLEKLVSDIEHTFKYYSFRLTRSEETEFHKIILCGGLANLDLLQNFLQERFDVPVEVDDPLRNIPVKKGAMTDSNYTDEKGLRFSVAIGSALRMLG